MLKSDFVNLLKSIDIPYSESEQDDVKKSHIFPRILLFEINWDFEIASNEVFDCIVTYQISYFSKIPRDKKLILLLNKLKENKMLHSNVSHEYISNGESYFHSFFTVDIKENILCMDN